MSGELQPNAFNKHRCPGLVPNRLYIFIKEQLMEIYFQQQEEGLLECFGVKCRENCVSVVL